MSKTIQEQIEIMQHFENDGQIETKAYHNSDWIGVDFPKWDWSLQDYRIKEQKTTITIEKWLISYKDDIYQILIGNRDYFNKNIHPQAKIKLLESYEVEL